jgi:enoyl-CoA hydratase/carnithine racemase
MWKPIRNRLFSTINKNILVSFHEKVALIKLNRPFALNSLNSELMNELVQTLMEVESNNSVSCAVLSGDLKSFAGNL